MDAEGRVTHGAVAEALKWTHSKLRNHFRTQSIGKNWPIEIRIRDRVKYIKQ
jgi:hypothetical protein